MKPNIIASVISLTFIAYLIRDFIRTKDDRVIRYAAGESLYEKTHQKRK
jgi:hypothetical protein